MRVATIKGFPLHGTGMNSDLEPFLTSLLHSAVRCCLVSLDSSCSFSPSSANGRSLSGKLPNNCPHGELSRFRCLMRKMSKEFRLEPDIMSESSGLKSILS